MIGIFISENKALTCISRGSGNNLRAEKTHTFDISKKSTTKKKSEDDAKEMFSHIQTTYKDGSVGICLEPKLVYFSTFSMPVRRKNITDHEIITACAAEFPDPIDSLFVQYKVLQKNREQWTIWACSVRKDIIETYKEAAEAQKIHVDAFYSPALLSTPTEKGYVLRVYNLEPCPPSIVLYKDGLPIDELLLPAKVTPAIIVKELKNLQKEYTEEESPIALELFTDAGTANDMKVPQKSSGKKNVMNEFLNMRLSPLCKSKAFGGSNSTYMLSALTASGSKNNLNLIIEKKSTTPTLLALAVVTTVLASIWIWYYLQA